MTQAVENGWIDLMTCIISSELQKEDVNIKNFKICSLIFIYLFFKISHRG